MENAQCTTLGGYRVARLEKKCKLEKARCIPCHVNDSSTTSDRGDILKQPSSDRRQFHIALETPIIALNDPNDFTR